MKFKIVFSILILLIITSFSYAIYLSLRLERTNTELSESIKEIEEAKSKYIALETSMREELEKCLNDGTRNSWQIASGTNTLIAYSNFVDNCNEEGADCKDDDLIKAVNSLLNTKGYVQMVETNGNPLFTSVNLSLEGEFIKFKTDKSVRNGAIGIPNCGSSSPVKTGIILQNKIVKVLDKCNASGSQSVWAHIQYAN
jgi:transcription elongation factor Elf1